MVQRPTFDLRHAASIRGKAVASFLTDYADQAVLLPVAAVVALALFVSGWHRGAFAWVLAVLGVLGFMLGLKVTSMACGHLLLGPELRSPSGHTAAAATIYGGLFVLVARRHLGGAGWCFVFPAAVALLIGTTRLALGVHTVVEVVLGAAVGVSGAAIAVRLAGRPPAGLHLGRLAATVAAVAVFSHGFHLRAEASIGHWRLLDAWPLSLCTSR
jgi:membrane-associated phospholipid phosphatase